MTPGHNGGPYDGAMAEHDGTVLLAAPRGYCAGVERAVDAVERALAKHGAPVYVRKQIVHNLHVVEDLEGKGAVFVDDETEVPEGALVVLSAHGVAPRVYDNSEGRRLEVIDATCPLVTKVHVEARRFARQGKTIVLIVGSWLASRRCPTAPGTRTGSRWRGWVIRCGCSAPANCTRPSN